MVATTATTTTIMSKVKPHFLLFGKVDLFKFIKSYEIRKSSNFFACLKFVKKLKFFNY